MRSLSNSSRNCEILAEREQYVEKCGTAKPFSLSALLVGNTDRPEFREARLCLEQWCTVYPADNVAAAIAILDTENFSPEFIVIAQAYPSQFSLPAIDRLRRRAPLAQVLGLMGSWTEGEMRSGSPWPAIVRNYGHQWTPRCNREMERLVQGGGCAWTLPATATEEERLSWDVSRDVCPSLRPANAQKPHSPRTGLIAIYSSSFEMADWLASACQRYGFATVWQRWPQAARLTGTTAAIYDATDLNRREALELQRLAESIRPVPVIALASFPRHEQRRRAASAGAAALLSKPLGLQDLLWQINALLSRPAKPDDAAKVSSPASLRDTPLPQSE